MEFLDKCQYMKDENLEPFRFQPTFVGTCSNNNYINFVSHNNFIA